MKIHDLKIFSYFFNAVIDERKTFEVRKQDRDFAAGDIIVLYEVNGGIQTGRKAICEITFILCGNQWCKEGYCILAIKLLKAYL